MREKRGTIFWYALFLTVQAIMLLKCWILGIVFSLLFVMLMAVAIIKYKKKRKECVLLTFLAILLIVRVIFFDNIYKEAERLNNQNITFNGIVTEKSLTKTERHKLTVTPFKKQNPTLEKEKKVIIYLAEADNISIGTYVQITGKMLELKPNSNYGGFNEQLYYRADGVLHKMYPDHITIISNKQYSIGRRLLDFKSNLARQTERIFSDENARLINGIILGDKSQISEEITELYSNNGIAHILSISGLHTSLIGYSIYKILRKIGINAIPRCVIASVLIILYSMLTGGNISTVRAAVMLIILLFGDVFNRTNSLLNSCSIMATTFILYRPIVILNSAFILSFGAVLSICLVSEELCKKIDREKKITKCIVSAIGITLGTMPIIAYFFYQLPLYSTIINMIIVPLMPILMIFIFLSLGISYISLTCAIPFVFCTEKIFLLIKQICLFAEKLPYANIVTGRPNILIIILYYLLLFTFIFIDVKKLKRSLALICCISIIGISSYNKSYMRIVFMDVGQGDGALITSVTGRSYLIDCGSSNKNNLGQYVLAPTIKYFGVNRIDYAFISHTDTDHISGIIELIERTKIDNIVLPNIIEKNDKYLEVEKLALENNINVLYMKAGDKIVDDELVFNCIYPYTDTQYQTSNEYSMVLEVNYRHYSALFTGDIGFEQESYLINSLKKYDLLKVAHHGSKKSTGEPFLDCTTPKIAVISCGINSYGHPSKDLLARLEKSGAKIYITREVGAVKIMVSRYTKREKYDKILK